MSLEHAMSISIISITVILSIRSDTNFETAAQRGCKSHASRWAMMAPQPLWWNFEPAGRPR